MKSSYYKTAALGLVTIAAVTVGYNQYGESSKSEKLRELHAEHLKNSPFRESLNLSKAERKRVGLPPNKFSEREWELTMNPATGSPQPEKVLQLQKTLKTVNTSFRAPGDGADNKWVERGPNNVGGRTRVVFFDPKDNTHKRAFAGAVTGGLWVTNDITTNGGWTKVAGIPSNLTITCYTIDPNNNDIWYVGTGEQYTFGQAVGRGVYKTTDAGVTWTQVLDVYDYDTDQGNNVFGGLHFINDIVAWDNNGSTVVYVGVATHLYGDAGNPYNFLGIFDKGLYYSTDAGLNWAKDTIVDKSVNDFEVDANGNLWFTTTTSPGINDAGGDIYKRNKGAATTFSLVTTIANVKRTELEASATNPNKFYVLAENSSSKPELHVTTDAFSTKSALGLPNDPDGSVAEDDFTRGQSFYDLVVEADPTNDNIIYLGGINVHRSADGGSTWNTISHWSTYYSTVGSPVHADQHALTFHPTDSNKAILGHDGGVSYATDLSATGNNLTVIYDVDNDYNVTQFYNGDIAPGSFNASKDFMLAGAQDNGTQYIETTNINPGSIEGGTDVSGGDGAYSFFDQVDTDYYITNYVYNNSIRLFDFSANAFRTVNQDNNNDGDFINPSGLDSNLDILYTNGSKGSTYRIYRYSGLENISASGSATKGTLTNALLTSPASAITVSPFTTSTSNVFIGTTDGKLLKVLNAGNIFGSGAWSDISGPSFVGSVSDVQFGTNEDEIFVTFHNYGVTSIWYTSDGGDNWVSKEGDLPDMPVKCILQNPLNTNEVIVGTELGVWKTSDITASTVTWTQSQNGMSDAKVMDLDVRLSDHTVLATTFGRGMFTGKFTDALSTSEFVDVAKAISVYPTISDGTFTISSKEIKGEALVSVYNVNGQLIKKDNLDLSSPQKIHLTSQSSGVYFVNIVSNTIKATKRVVIK